MDYDDEETCVYPGKPYDTLSEYRMGEDELTFRIMDHIPWIEHTDVNEYIGNVSLIKSQLFNR